MVDPRTAGPGISQRAMVLASGVGWSFILEPGRERKLASGGEGGPRVHKQKKK